MTEISTLTLGAEISARCSDLHTRDNLTEEDFWVVEYDSVMLPGTGYSLVKGKKAHCVLNMNGSIYARPTGRNRTGFWVDDTCHIARMRVSINGSESDKSLKKYVRSFGYLFRQYDELDRIDFIPPDKGILTMIFLPRKDTKINIELEISHLKAWPSQGRASGYRISHSKGIEKITSDMGETRITVPEGGKVDYSVGAEMVTVLISFDKSGEVSIMGDSSNPGKDDFSIAIDQNCRIKEYSILKSPDFRLNKLFTWAKHDLLEFYSESTAGKGFIAGLPGYSWYFGRDGEWMSLAATEVGLSDLAKRHQDLLWNYSLDGRIPHELPVGKGVDDYGYNLGGKEVQTRFMSIDSSPLWIINSIHLSNWTDRRYDLKRIEEILAFIRTCDRDKDGLIENRFSEGLIGWVEQWAKERDGICVDANAWWIQSERMYNVVTGHNENGWRNALSRFMSLFLDGSPSKPVIFDSVNNGTKTSIRTPMSLVPVMYFADELGKAGEQVLSDLSGDDMLVPWGVRSLSDQDAKYDDGYHTGMVWPLMTGWYALAAFSTGKIELAMKLLYTFVSLAFDAGDPGRIGEVYSSSDMRLAGQFFQGWSSSLLITAIVEGLFGLTLDSMCRDDWESAVKPNLPPSWKNMALLKMKKGDHAFDLLVNSKGNTIKQLT